MNSLSALRDLCVGQLTKPAQDMVQSNEMWNRRVKEFRLGTAGASDGCLAFLSSHAELKGRTVLDVGCGSGRYLKQLLDAGALAEGLEPSTEMVKEAKDFTARPNGAPVVIHNAAFQDFESAEGYDYLFIAHSPVISYYENYPKILRLARRGLFVVSWLKNEDRFLEDVAKMISREPHTHGGYDSLFLMNLLMADGYFPDFRTDVVHRSGRTSPETLYLRYTSWLFGQSFTEQDLKIVKAAVDSFADGDGTVPVARTQVQSMMYCDLIRS